MGLTLYDSEERTFSMNAWNWGVLHHVIRIQDLFPEERWAPLRSGGGSLEAPEIATLVDFLEHLFLPELPPGHRMFFDCTTTDAPDNGTLYRGDEMAKNYSLHHDVLVAFIAYLKTTVGTVRFW